MKIVRGFEDAKRALSRRVAAQDASVSPNLAAGLKNMFGTEQPEQAVGIIIADVRKRGDAALRDLSLKISGVKLDAIEVSHDEIEAAAARVPQGLLSDLQTAAGQIKYFHDKQFAAYHEGLGRMAPGTVFRVLERVGLYVPGGTASYPSSVLMTAIPALSAGVGEIIICTPSGKDGRIPDMTLAAVKIVGNARVFAVGGAQAVAAMAYGTESIPPVDKICGPGNIFVMLAKKQVYGTVDIDGLQGPSEVLIIADEYADPSRCAADMLAQAEHDSLAQSVLVTTSELLARKVQEEVESAAKTFERQATIEESLARAAVICVVENLRQAVELANDYAPEHLVILTVDSSGLAADIRNAGCVFVGKHATVVMGDYIAGPSHALPTSGTARFASPLNVTDFVRLMNIVDVDDRMMSELGAVAARLAEAEGLTAHARAVLPDRKET
ncbi:MAG: histidinol dehydrogenase [Dehalococcoidia bacterium]|nr:histidinol dehydrogenase [Dehalococcoidia bacterium]